MHAASATLARDKKPLRLAVLEKILRSLREWFDAIRIRERDAFGVVENNFEPGIVARFENDRAKCFARLAITAQHRQIGYDDLRIRGVRSGDICYIRTLDSGFLVAVIDSNDRRLW